MWFSACIDRASVRDSAFKSEKATDCVLLFPSCLTLSYIFMRVAALHPHFFQVVTYDQCVQEVMLRRATGDQDYKERLAHFVVTRSRSRQKYRQQLSFPLAFSAFFFFFE